MPSARRDGFRKYSTHPTDFCPGFRCRSIRATATPSPRVRAIRREQVAAPPDSPDHACPPRIGLDLFADASDAYVDSAVEGLTVARLGEVKEPLAREHALGVLGERLEQRKFGACERVLVAALIAQHARIDVQPLGPEPDRRA